MKSTKKIRYLNDWLSYLVICKVFKSHNRTPASEEQAIVFPSNWRRGCRWIFDSNELRVPRHFSLSWASDQILPQKNAVCKGLVKCLLRSREGYLTKTIKYSGLWFYTVGISNLRECTATGLSGGGGRHSNDRESGMLVDSLRECILQVFCLT